jgi:hypothetical protein
MGSPTGPEAKVELASLGRYAIRRVKDMAQPGDPVLRIRITLLEVGDPSVWREGAERAAFRLGFSLVLELSEEELDALVEEATVDAYNDEEQLGGFAVMMEDNLEMPFETTVLGVMVTVKGVTQTESGIVADCVRDGQHQAISILHLPLPEPPPKGAEWIAAYRHWARYA